MIVVVVAGMVVGMVVVVARLPLKATISQSLQNFPTFPLIYCIMSFNKFLSTLFFNGNLSATKNNNIISSKKFYLIGDEQCYQGPSQHTQKSNIFQQVETCSSNFD